MINYHAKVPRKSIEPKMKAVASAASSGTAVSSENSDTWIATNMVRIGPLAVSQSRLLTRPRGDSKWRGYGYQTFQIHANILAVTKNLPSFTKATNLKRYIFLCCSLVAAGKTYQIHPDISNALDTTLYEKDRLDIEGLEVRFKRECMLPN
jgi:hypothetical protein